MPDIILLSPLPPLRVHKERFEDLDATNIRTVFKLTAKTKVTETDESPMEIVGERSAKHRFPCGAAGIVKGDAVIPLNTFTGEKSSYSTQRKVNGTFHLTDKYLVVLPVTKPYFPPVFTGVSGFLSFPGMYGLHGCARTGLSVFHTTLN